jgi:UDP-2-acetamido-2,6-beta-L-arabino-hexul-4-ose reductase
MRIAISGAHGFMGQNLRVRLAELGHKEPVLLPHDVASAALDDLLFGVDFVFHLAGVNRPKDVSEFDQGNRDFTARLCAALSRQPAPPRLVYASSTQAALGNPYGQSKRAAEDQLLAYAARTGARVHLFRLTNVFGKWSRPNYNSAVATFCHNVSRGLPITVNDPNAAIKLVYVDDVMTHFCALLDDGVTPTGFAHAGPEYDTTVGELAALIQAFHQSRATLLTDRVGTGLTRALYATYISFLPLDQFEYEVPRHGDPRGVFVEMLKTPDCGQFAYFTAHPGVTRGEHYHHTKTEKFLVITGRANFGFRHIYTNETHHIIVTGGEGRIVETIPGWTHNVTNVGNDELVVLVWANEVFDRARPDTTPMRVSVATHG